MLGYLAEHGYPAERIAHSQPVSILAGQPVLVTQFVEGVRPERGGVLVYRLGSLLGRLHCVPRGSGAADRPAGGWHHLSIQGGRRADDVAALLSLLGRLEERLPAEQRPLLDPLRTELSAIDDGSGLPEAVHHPDFTISNVIDVPGAGAVLVDWSGAGHAPRILSLGVLLATAGRSSRLVEAIVSGYRRHLMLDAEELARLPSTIGAFGLILDAWSVVLGRAALPDVVAGLATKRERAAAIAQQARAAFAA